MKPVQVGLIGAGGIARNVHLPSLKDMEDIDLVAICDLIRERAVAMADKHFIPHVYTLYREMFDRENLDAVFVLVEPASLYHVVWQCLDAGLDTFMEKPPGITLYQAESLCRKAAEAGHILQVGFPGMVGNIVQVAVRIRRPVIDGRGDHSRTKRLDAEDRFSGARRTDHMTGHRLGGADRH